MDLIVADERDSTWERDDPRFRIYVFTAPASEADPIPGSFAVQTTDVVEASIDEALEAASASADDDAQLWSLAIVEDDARGLRGLLWLSGTDYHDAPDGPRQWRARALMQDRCLRARVRRGLAPVLPDGRRVIRLFPEYGDGLLVSQSVTERYRLEPADLGLDEGRDDPLVERLLAWNNAWQDIQEGDAPSAEWWDEGERLRADLQAALGDDAEVRPDYLF